LQVPEFGQGTRISFVQLTFCMMHLLYS
jgi:hypothetical protein